MTQGELGQLAFRLCGGRHCGRSCGLRSQNEAPTSSITHQFQFSHLKKMITFSTTLGVKQAKQSYLLVKDSPKAQRRFKRRDRSVTLSLNPRGFLCALE